MRVVVSPALRIWWQLSTGFERVRRLAMESNNERGACQTVDHMQWQKAQNNTSYLVFATFETRAGEDTN